MLDKIRKIAKKLVVAVCVIAIIALPFLGAWGIGWSFHHHGLKHGFAALFLPPYAVYRGIASFGEFSPEDADGGKINVVSDEANVYMLGKYITFTPKDSELCEEIMGDLTEWVDNLSASYRSELEKAAHAYRDALRISTISFMSPVIEEAPGEIPLFDKKKAQEQILIFSNFPGFVYAWKEHLADIEEQTKSLNKIYRFVADRGGNWSDVSVEKNSEGIDVPVAQTLSHSFSVLYHLGNLRISEIFYPELHQKCGTVYDLYDVLGQPLFSKEKK